MLIRTKAIATISIVSGALLLFIYAYMQATMLENYNKLESEKVFRNIEQVGGMLEMDFGASVKTTVDWAQWDDMAEYATGDNENFIERNIDLTTFDNLQMNVIIILNKSFFLLYRNNVDFRKLEELPFPESLMDKLTEGNLLARGSAENGDVDNHGLVMLDEGMMIIAAETIKKTGGKGNASGYLVMGRWLDEEKIADFGAILKKPIEIHRFDGKIGDEIDKRAVDALKKNSSSYITAFPNESLISGYSAFDDIYGNPAVGIEIESERTYYAEGKAAITQFVHLVLIAGIVTILAIVFMLNQLVFGRIMKIRNRIMEIGAGKFGLRVEKTGENDEITTATDSMNKMLDRLQDAREKIKDSEEKFRFLAENQKDVVLRISPEGRVGYVSPAVSEFGGYSQEEVTGSLISNYFEDKAELLSAYKLIERMSHDLRPGSIEFLFRPKGQEPFFVEVSGRPAIENGKMASIQCVMRDISERKKYEENISREREKAEKYLNVASFMILVLNPEGKIELINQKGAEILGENRENIIGKDWFSNFLPPENRKEAHDVFDQIISGHVEKVEKYENEIVNVKGERRIIDWHNAAVKDNTGKIVATIGSGEDVTKMKEIEGKLKEEQARFKSMYEQSPLGFSFYNKEGILTDMNKATLELLGIDSLEDNKMASIFGLPTQTQEDIIRLKNGLILEKVVEFDFDMVKSAGLLKTRKSGKRIVDTIAVPLITVNAAAPTGYLMIFEDITDQKKAEKSLGESVEQMKQIDQTKTEFLNMVSHELKTPITAISAHLDVIDLMKQNLNEQELKSIEAIRRNKEALRMLIENILEISRMETGRFELNYDNVDLEALLGEITTENKLQAEEKGIQLLTDAEPIEMEADEIRLKEIIVNLVSNAIKFTDKGEVRIKAERKGEFAEISVIDTGIGIPKEKIEKLFQKFYQVDAKVDRKFGGSGLGLAIVKKLVEAHGGRVTIDSIAGKGTVITAIMPLRKNLGDRK
ncbi:MAG: PAS domain S-box protein [Candidatus Micrarchaeota archaeon]